MAENAAVSLARQGHSTPASLKFSGHLTGTASLSWVGPSQQMRATYNDEGKAASEGAYGIAVLIMQVVYNQEPALQSAIRTGPDATGIDYWMVPSGDKSHKYTSRLEVSGINKGTKSDINRRKREKIDQSKQSDSYGITAYIIVVEFGNPIAEVFIR